MLMILNILLWSCASMEAWRKKHEGFAEKQGGLIGPYGERKGDEFGIIKGTAGYYITQFQH